MSAPNTDHQSWTLEYINSKYWLSTINAWIYQFKMFTFYRMDRSPSNTYHQPRTPAYISYQYWSKTANAWIYRIQILISHHVTVEEITRISCVFFQRKCNGGKKPAGNIWAFSFNNRSIFEKAAWHDHSWSVHKQTTIDCSTNYTNAFRNLRFFDVPLRSEVISCAQLREEKKGHSGAK